MDSENNRTVITVIRRIVFAGLIILIAWFLLIALRGAISEDLIRKMNEGEKPEEFISYDTATWDWTVSLRTGEPVSGIIGERLDETIQFISLCALSSFILAAILLTLGYFTGKATARPAWLARIISILRLLLVSNGVSTPVFAVGTVFVIFITVGGTQSLQPDSLLLKIWTVCFSSLLPAWLLVQYGHGELANLNENTPAPILVRHMAIRLIIRLLKMVGIIIVISMSAGLLMYRGLGSVLVSHIYMGDFPVIFGITWLFIIIVTVVKLIAGLAEIAYNHYMTPISLQEEDEEWTPLRLAIPNGWLIFCFVLVAVSALVALIGPYLAPYGYNEIILADRVAPPSAMHILGADNLGRDIFSRILYGIRIDVFAGLTCAVMMPIIATGWAMLSIYVKKAGSWLGDTLEELVMLPVELACAFPWLALLLLIMSMQLRDISIFIISLVIGLILLPRAVVMIREAYISSPAERSWIKNLLLTLPSMLIFVVAAGILYLSTASYLGLGVPPPSPELGSMLAGTGRQYMLEAPWMTRWPVICLSLLLTIWVMAGDALLEKLGFRSKAVWAKAME
ncbi:hypothetical protein ACFLYN_00255 [Chloroflexota bacterium]